MTIIIFAKVHKMDQYANNNEQDIKSGDNTAADAQRGQWQVNVICDAWMGPEVSS